jgi:hypothetical protein
MSRPLARVGQDAAMPSVIAHHYADECPGVPNVWPVIVVRDVPELSRLARRTLALLCEGPRSARALGPNPHQTAGVLPTLTRLRLARRDDHGVWHATDRGRDVL